MPSRRKDLLLEELDDETVVYDPVRFKAHCLNRTARLVFAHCDGKTALLKQELKTSVDDDMVWQALEQLSRARLLEQPVAPPARRGRDSRRELGRKLAGVAAAVVSMTVPTAAYAANSGQIGSCCDPAQNDCPRCKSGFRCISAGSPCTGSLCKKWCQF